MSSAEPLLCAEDVSLSFGGVRALDGVSFDVVRAEIRAIIGPNGAGKSSMLNVIMFLPSTTGHYYLQRQYAPTRAYP